MWRLVYGLAIAMSVDVTAAAGDKGPLTGKVVQALENVVTSAEPEWRLERSTNYGYHLIQLWERRPKEGETAASAVAGKPKGVQIQVFDLATPEAAAIKLRETLASSSISHTGALDGVGDEAYIWANYNKRGGTTIRVRSGRVMIWISGPSIETAKKFTSHMLQGVGKYLADTKGATGGDRPGEWPPSGD